MSRGEGYLLARDYEFAEIVRSIGEDWLGVSIKPQYSGGIRGPIIRYAIGARGNGMWFLGADCARTYLQWSRFGSYYGPNGTMTLRKRILSNPNCRRLAKTLLVEVYYSHVSEDIVAEAHSLVGGN